MLIQVRPLMDHCNNPQEKRGWGRYQLLRSFLIYDILIKPFSRNRQVSTLDCYYASGQ